MLDEEALTVSVTGGRSNPVRWMEMDNVQK